MNRSTLAILRKPSPVTKALAAVLAISAVLMVAWSFVVPIFESPDEQSHWEYARYVRHYKRLPPYTKQQVEGNSPPLYYILVAPFAVYTVGPPPLMWVGSAGVDFGGFPRFAENTSADFHRYWPVRITRLATVAISLVTVLFCFLGGLEATGKIETAALAGGLAGFLPEFSFRGMSISNDALVTALGAVLIYLIIRFVRRGSMVRSRILAAVIFAAAFLSKINAIFFPLPLALSMIGGEAGDNSPTRPGITQRLARLWVFGISLLLAAPWLIRNQIRYGDPLASRAMLQVVDFLVTKSSITSPYFPKIFAPLLARSYVAVFGWMNLLAPNWIYRVFAGIGLLSCLGLLIGIAVRKIDRKIVTLLALAFVLNLAVVVYINLTFNQPQGRYMFPSLAAAAVLCALGLDSLPYWNRILSCLILLVVLFLNVYLLTRVVYPAYWPAPVSDISMAAAAIKVSSTTDVSRGDSELSYVITGDDPRFNIFTDISTEGLNFLGFGIAGPKEAGLQTGVVHFTFEGEPAGADHVLTFRWRGNGIGGTVYVPLYKLPDWKGRVSSITIEPFRGGAAKYKGSTIVLGHLRLVGVISVIRDIPLMPERNGGPGHNLAVKPG